MGSFHREQLLATASKKHHCTPGGQLGVLSSKLVQTNGSVSGNSTRKLVTYRLSLRETSYLYTFLSYIVYPCQTQDDGCHIPFPVNLRREEMPRYMFRPVIMNATTIYPGTAVLHPPCPDAGFLLSPLLEQAVPAAEYFTSATRSAPAHYMVNISMEVRCMHRGCSRLLCPPTYPFHQHRNMLQQQLRCLICQPVTCLYPRAAVTTRM